MMSDETKVKCPECATDIPLGAAAKVFDKSSITFELSAHEGELLSAETIGGAITNAAKLLKAVAKEQGFVAEVLVTGMKYKNGKLSTRMLVCRLERGLKKRRRREMVRRMAGEDRTP